MKKSKLLIVGLIGVLMVLGVIFIGCNDHEKCDGKCHYYPDDRYQNNVNTCTHLDNIGYDDCYKECAARQAYENGSIFETSCNCD